MPDDQFQVKVLFGEQPAKVLAFLDNLIICHAPPQVVGGGDGVEHILTAEENKNMRVDAAERRKPTSKLVQVTVKVTGQGKELTLGGSTFSYISTL